MRRAQGEKNPERIRQRMGLGGGSVTGEKSTLKDSGFLHAIRLHPKVKRKENFVSDAHSA